MKKFLWILAAASALLFAACEKYDDSALQSEIKALTSRVETIEKILNNDVSNLKKLVESLSNRLYVTGVTGKDGSWVFSFSDGNEIPISTSIVGVKEIDGVYYWTVNDKIVTYEDGSPVPVASAGPVFRTTEQGGLEYSVDGENWYEVSAAGSVELEETDDAYILVFGETRITLPKAQAFTLKIQAPATLVIPYGETATLAYTIAGAGDNDITEVDVLNNGMGFEAEVNPETGARGSISITNKTNSGSASIKVFVYASNHTGQSDIKALVFKTEQGDEPEPVPEVIDFNTYLGSWTNMYGTLQFTQYIDDEGPTENIYEMTNTQFMDGMVGVPCGYAEFEVRDSDQTVNAIYFMTVTLAEEGNWTYFFAALDSDNYIETGGTEGDEILAFGVLNEDSDLYFFGNEYDAVYSGTEYHEEIVALSIFAYLSEQEGQYEPGYYSFENVTQLDLPATFSRSVVSLSLDHAKLSVATGEGLSRAKVRQPLVLGKKLSFNK